MAEKKFEKSKDPNPINPAQRPVTQVNAKYPVNQTDVKYIVRIMNTDVDGHKKINMALLKIKGIGQTFSNFICHKAKIDKNTRAGTLNQHQIDAINDVVKNPHKYNAPLWILNRRKDMETGEDKHLIMSDLTFVQENDVKLLKKIKCYRGMRHAYGLPSRGQRTKSNFRRNKGKGLGVKKKTTEKRK